MLPSFGFNRSTHARTISRDGHLGRHDRWDKGRFYQKEVVRRRALFASQADARRRALGNLVVTCFVVIAVGMAAVALHREAELNHLQQQVH